LGDGHVGNKVRRKVDMTLAWFIAALGSTALHIEGVISRAQSKDEESTSEYNQRTTLRRCRLVPLKKKL
jgi:hypothetical protein